MSAFNDPRVECCGRDAADCDCAGRFLAIINTPGYLPMDDEPPSFDTARGAWEYLREELERGELAWTSDDPSDPNGPASCTPAALEIDRMAERDQEGTVYGPSCLDDDCTHDLGLAYSVVPAE